VRDNDRGILLSHSSCSSGYGAPQDHRCLTQRCESY
jgi:hypothetical protein